MLLRNQRQLKVESLEDRRVLAANPVTGDGGQAVVAAADTGSDGLQVIRFRNNSESEIEFDDTRLGNIFINDASGIERFLNINHRSATGAKEYGLFGLANLFDLLPATNGGQQIEIASATLTLSSNYGLGIGASISVHPIVSSWLDGAPGKNESNPDLHGDEKWAATEFGSQDYSGTLGTTINWSVGANTFDVTESLSWMYETSHNQGFAVVANYGADGGDADILVSTSDHWIPEERPELKISYRYTDLNEELPVDGTVSPDLKILSETLPNTADSATPLVRYYSEDPTLSTIAHAQSGELTGFSPNGQWQHMLVGLRNWYLRNTETGEIRFVHKDAQGGSSHNYFQWTERNTYLRFSAPGVLEEVEPESLRVINTTTLTAAVVDENLNLDFAQFRLGESSGADGIYVEQRHSYDNRETERWFINVIDTSDGDLRESQFFEFDSQVHGDAAIANRWRELFFTNDTFSVHLSPFGTPGSGSNGLGGNVYYAFDGQGANWRQTSYTSSNADSVLGESQSHRSLETIDGTTYYAYSTWRGKYAYVVVAELESGEEIAALQLPQDEVPQHIHFFNNELTYSIMDIDGVRNLRIEAMTVDVAAKQFGEQRVVAETNTTGQTFIGNARPFGDGQGNYCWHSHEFSRGLVVDLICAETGFDPTTVDPEPTMPTVNEDNRFQIFLSLSRELTERQETGESIIEVLNQIYQLFKVI